MAQERKHNEHTYEFVKRQVVEEVATLQEKLFAIQTECIDRIKELPVSSELEDIKMIYLIKSQISFSFRSRIQKVRLL